MAGLNTLTERGDRYGPFDEMAIITQRLKDAMRASAEFAQMPSDVKEALDMIQHKIARIINGDERYLDSWDDIIGYAQLVVNRLEKQGVTR